MISVLEKRFSPIKGLFLDVLIAAFGSVLIAMAAPLSCALPFSVIPLTFQVHLALLVAFLLGKKRGVLAVALFLMQGAMGAPVFAGGACGIAHLLGPRGGYLFGYLMGALFIQRWSPITLKEIFFVFIGANLVVYFFGVLFLSTFMSPFKALECGVFPFIIGDFLKTIAISACAKSLRSDSPFQRQR